MTISSRLTQVGNYVHLDLKAKARQVEQEKQTTVLDLGAGNPHIAPSDQAIMKLAELVQMKENYRYPGYDAIPEFAQALQQSYKNDYQVTLETNELLPLLGAKDGLNGLTLALLNSGDEVLVPDPGYPAYGNLAKLYGMTPVLYQFMNTAGELDVSLIKQKTTNKTKLLWLNFPSNPTGIVADKEALTEIVKWCTQKKIWLAYDNPYSQVYFDKSAPPSILQIPGAKKVAVEIGSLSKSHSLAGLRIGWVAGNAQAIQALKAIKSQLDSGMSLPLQKLAAYLLSTDNKEWQRAIMKTYQESMGVVAQLLTDLGLQFTLPQAGLYIWAKIPDTFSDGTAYAQYLLEEKAILVTPGSAFGPAGTRYIRASVTQKPEIIERYL